MFNQAITRFKDFLWRLPWGVFLLILLAFLVLKNGLWPVPNIDLVRSISLDLQANPVAHLPRQQYLMYSYVGPFLGHWLGTNVSIQAYVFMHFFIWLAATVAILQGIRRKFGDDLGRLAGLALVGLPVTTTCLVWLGDSDVFVFLASSLLFLTTSWVVAFLVGIFFGVAHFELGVLIGAALLGSAWLIGNPRLLNGRALLLSLVGMVLGRMALQEWFEWNHFHLGTDRFQYVLTADPDRFARGLVEHFGILTLSLFGAFWPYVIFRFEALRETRRPLFWGLSAWLLGAVAILCIVLDSTRIFALLSWPLVLLLLPGMIEEGARRDELRKTFLACAMAAVVFPPLMVWSGKVFSSANFIFADRLITAAQDSEPVFPDNYKMYNDLYK